MRDLHAREASSVAELLVADPQLWSPAEIRLSLGHPVSGLCYKALALFEWSVDRWSLTHASSGARLTFLRGTLEAVLPVATELADAADWSTFEDRDYRRDLPDAPLIVLAAAARHPEIVEISKNCVTAGLARQVCRDLEGAA